MNESTWVSPSVQKGAGALQRGETGVHGPMGAETSEGDFQNTVFQDADIRDIDFRDMDFRDADFRVIDSRDTDFRGRRLSGR